MNKTEDEEIDDEQMSDEDVLNLSEGIHPTRDLSSLMTFLHDFCAEYG